MPIHDRVLLTGAAGALGSQLRRDGAAWATRLRLTDRVPVADLAAHEEDRPADLDDLGAMLDLAEGCDAIVHFGGQSREGPWSAVLQSNVVGTYNVYEAARRRGVRRVVYASSIHAVGFHDRASTIDAEAPVRPDSLYRVSKTFGESLSRYYFDKFGIESVCLRIGSCFPKPTDRRHLITWLSYRDLRQLVGQALLAERVGHLVAMPTSDNGASFWDDRAARILGFRPIDSAEAYRDKVLASTPRGDPNDPAVRFQGGSFCEAGHFEEEDMRRGYEALLAEARTAIRNHTPAEAAALIRDEGFVLIDLRDPREVERDGRIPGAKHCPRGMLEFWIDPESPYHKPYFATGKGFVFYCASGWRSALATKTAQEMGLDPVGHIDGGFTAWKSAGWPVVPGDDRS